MEVVVVGGKSIFLNLRSFAHLGVAAKILLSQFNMQEKDSELSSLSLSLSHTHTHTHTHARTQAHALPLLLTECKINTPNLTSSLKLTMMPLE